MYIITNINIFIFIGTAVNFKFIFCILFKFIIFKFIFMSVFALLQRRVFFHFFFYTFIQYCSGYLQQLHQLYLLRRKFLK